MRRLALLAAAALGGLAVGAGVMLLLGAGGGAAVVTLPTASTVGPPVTVAGSTVATTTTQVPVTAPPTTMDPPSAGEVLLVWTSGRLPSGIAAEVGAVPGVTAVTMVRSDIVELVATTTSGGLPAGDIPDGFVVPVELMSFDPSTYPDFLPAGAAPLFAGLAESEAVLGETSARLRGIGPGGAVELSDGTRLEVVAVVEDVLIGAAEIGVARDPASTAPASTERYLLARHSAVRAEVEAAIRAIMPETSAARVRGPGETPVLRHGDAVLPQIQIKDRFGEFAIRPDGDRFEIDPAWVEANIATADVPLLGEVRCSRILLPALIGAMAELEQRNLAFLIDPGGFRGCWHPRYIAGRKGISRHSWGAAVDLNFTTSATGLSSPQDPRLLEVMERWGFTSGHDWLVPDPGHFEYIRPPAP